MRVLHIGSGFRPWRAGGLVAYIEDLMAEQVRRGHDVTYLFSGRQYPLARGPRLRSWQLPGVRMLEIVNSPLYDHGRQPELEIAAPRVDQLFRHVLREIGPDIVHIQELAGLPFSLLDVADEAGVPTVVTLQDYFPVCSAFKLLDADGRICNRAEIGEDCRRTVFADDRPAGLLIDATLRHHVMLSRLPVGAARREALLNWAAPAISAVEARRRRGRDATPGTGAFQRRRELNVERLNRVDRLIAMSERVAELYAERGVDHARVQTMQLTLEHIENLRPRRITGEPPLVFATLAAFESVSKGARLLIDAVRALESHATAGRFQVLVFGGIDDDFAAEARNVPGFVIGRRYSRQELDAILDTADVGLMPSIWEEAYGYAGVEFLAKGIPVIANALGGMPEYTRPGVTGWLNQSCSAGELADIMRGLIESPGKVAEMNASVLSQRDSIVKPMHQHGQEMDAMYAEVLAARG